VLRRCTGPSKLSLANLRSRPVFRCTGVISIPARPVVPALGRHRRCRPRRERRCQRRLWVFPWRVTCRFLLTFRSCLDVRHRQRCPTERLMRNSQRGIEPIVRRQRSEDELLRVRCFVARSRSLRFFRSSRQLSYSHGREEDPRCAARSVITKTVPSVGSAPNAGPRSPRSAQPMEAKAARCTAPLWNHGRVARSVPGNHHHLAGGSMCDGGTYVADGCSSPCGTWAP
jgi:hypothetical protein